MFIYNIKISGSKIFKIVFAVICIITIIFFILSALKIFKANSNVTVNDDIKQSDVAIIKPEDYTNILRMVYEDIDNYVGQKISFTGFVYRVPDISKTQFVLARNMYIDETARNTCRWIFV